MITKGRGSRDGFGNSKRQQQQSQKKAMVEAAWHERKQEDGLGLGNLF